MTMDAASRPFQPFPAPPTLKTQLQNSPEHSVPLLEDLLGLQQELLALKEKTQVRAKKADTDLKAFTGLYSAAKEKAKAAKLKGKEREKERSVVGVPVVKIKREFSGTPDDDSPSRPFVNGNRKPPNPSAAKAAAIKAATSAPSSQSSVQTMTKPHKIKHKRKKLDESEDDAESNASDMMPPPSQKPRPSPHPSTVSIPKAKTNLHPKPPAITTSLSLSHVNGSHPPPSVAHSITPSHHPPPPPSIVSDFTIPPKPPLPAKPVGAASGGFTWTPTPTDPWQVMEDFSDRKAPPNQTPIHSFWKEVESWMKPVGEEDVAWLEFDADDVEPFLIPALGRHYLSVWEEEDRQAAIAAAQAAERWPRGYSLDRGAYMDVDDPESATSPPTANGIQLHNPYPAPDSAVSKGKAKESDVVPGLSPTLASWDPKTVADADLPKEEKGLGPVSERISSAFLLEDGGAPKAKEEDGSTKLSASAKGAAGASGASTAGELEARVRAELKALGLFGDDDLDFSSSMDDDITSSLRRCQVLLQEQRNANLLRKNRLLSIAKDRLAYQDYLNTLEGLEKSISGGFGKMLKSQKAATKKKKDKDKGIPNGVEEGTPTLSRVVLDPPEPLIEKVRLRERWVNLFGKAMREWEDRDPGRLTGLPQKSIYEDLESTSKESSS